MRTMKLMGALLLCTLAFPTALRADVSLKPQSKLWLTGDSTLHPYRSTATLMNLQADLQSPDPLSDVRSFKVTITVQGLKSGEKGLDKNMYKALKAEEFPSIEFRLTDKRLLPGAPAGTPNKMTSNGVLTIAGKENAIQIDSQYESTQDGVRIVGEKKLLMSDYGIKPPTILGVIKVRDEVVIHFDLVIGGL